MACFNKFYSEINSYIYVQHKNLCCVYLISYNNFSIIFVLPAALNKLKLQHQEDPNSTTLVANKPFLLRSLFTVGALARHFDFDLEEFKGNNKVGRQSQCSKKHECLKVLNTRKRLITWNCRATVQINNQRCLTMTRDLSVCLLQVVIKEKVLELLLYFTKHEDEEVKTKAIIGLGRIIFLFFY